MKACVLQVGIVLIRPEPRDVVVHDALTNHVAGRGGTMLDRVLPVLVADVAAKDRMIMIRHIACGVHTTDVGPAEFVDNYAVVQVNVATSERVDRRFHADASHHKVAIKTLTAFGDHTLDTSGSLESDHGILEDRSHPVRAVEPGDRFSHGFAEYAKERCLCGVEGDHFETCKPERRGDL